MCLVTRHPRDPKHPSRSHTHDEEIIDVPNRRVEIRKHTHHPRSSVSSRHHHHHSSSSSSDLDRRRTEEVQVVRSHDTFVPASPPPMVSSYVSPPIERDTRVSVSRSRSRHESAGPPPVITVQYEDDAPKGREVVVRRKVEREREREEPQPSFRYVVPPAGRRSQDYGKGARSSAGSLGRSTRERIVVRESERAGGRREYHR